MLTFNSFSRFASLTKCIFFIKIHLSHYFVTLSGTFFVLPCRLRLKTNRCFHKWYSILISSVKWNLIFLHIHLKSLLLWWVQTSHKISYPLSHNFFLSPVGFYHFTIYFHVPHYLLYMVCLFDSCSVGKWEGVGWFLDTLLTRV